MTARASRWLWLAIGAGAVVLPVLPLPAWVGARDSGPAAWGDTVGAWAIGGAVLAAVAALAGWLGGRPPPVTRWRLPRVSTPVFLGALAVWTIVAAGLVAHAAFARNPHLIDEVAQLFQARVFASGRLAAPAPMPPEFFLFPLTGVTAAGWVTQFPPGHSLLLAAGTLTGRGLEWLLNPLLAAASTLLIYRLGRGLYGPKTGRLAAFLWATCSWALFMSGSYMNHVPAVFWALAAWVSVLHRRPALAGAALGMLLATRPLDAVAAALPLAVWLALRRRWTAIVPIGLGAAPVLALLAIYHARLFGSPFTLGYTAMYGPAVGLGFHVDPYGEPFTPLIALSNLAMAIRRLHIYVNEWPVPALLPLALWALLARPRRPADLVTAVGVAAAPVLYFFYWHSGFYLGPRFHYLALPFLLLGTARAWRWMVARARGRRAGPVSLRPALLGGAAALLIWSWTMLVPARLNTYASSLPMMKLHPERELARAGIIQAVVLVPESWGSRVIAGWWGLGVDPGRVERAYRTADLCDLSLVLDQARAEGAGSERAAALLDSLLAATPVAAPRLRGARDPTTRLRPPPERGGTLPEPCAAELRRDEEGEGFASYVPFAWRNRPALDRGLVFARDLFQRDSLLAPRFAGWPVFRLYPPSAGGGAYRLEQIGVFPPLETQ